MVRVCWSSSRLGTSKAVAKATASRRKSRLWLFWWAGNTLCKARNFSWAGQLVTFRAMSVSSCYIPCWIVGSLSWYCWCFCSPAKGRAGARGREGTSSSSTGSSILESRQNTAAGSGCSVFPVSSKLGGITFYLAFFFYCVSCLVYRQSTDALLSKGDFLVGAFVIIREDLQSNLSSVQKQTERQKCMVCTVGTKWLLAAVESSHSVQQ